MHKKIVIKIGSNVLCKDDGTLDLDVMKNIVDQVAKLKDQNIDVIMVSSGAMGAGRTMIDLPKSSSDISRRQILAAVGQVKLMETYKNFLAKHGYLCAQILATKEDFRDRNHYLNMRNCFEALLHDKIIPIVNENDVVSVSELMFTDNDELAGLIASMMNTDSLIVLSCVDGIFDKDPSEKDAKIIHHIDPLKNDYQKYIAPTKSMFGRGGMATKCEIAARISKLGISTHIMHGKKKNIILKALKEENIGTKFAAQKNISSVKKWIAHSKGQEKGKIHLKEEAINIISSKEKAYSLLPIGITKISGDFKKGDIVELCDEKNQSIGLGITQYDSKKARSFIGKKDQKALIHYNYLYLEN
jgi:glutamate 5-kinase